MKSYSELDKMYNAGEYQQLIDNFSHQSVLYKNVEYFLRNKEIFTVRYNNSFIYHSLSQYLCTYFTSVYRIMYMIPYNNLALHVNIKDVHCPEVLKWRLTISK